MKCQSIEVYALKPRTNMEWFMTAREHVLNRRAWRFDYGVFDDFMISGIMLARQQPPRFHIILRPFELIVYRIDDSQYLDTLTNEGMWAERKWEFRLGKPLTVYWRYRMRNEIMRIVNKLTGAFGAFY